jgi:hypothetical protein
MQKQQFSDVRRDVNDHQRRRKRERVDHPHSSNNSNMQDRGDNDGSRERSGVGASKSSNGNDGSRHYRPQQQQQQHQKQQQQQYPNKAVAVAGQQIPRKLKRPNEDQYHQYHHQQQHHQRPGDSQQQQQQQQHRQRYWREEPSSSSASLNRQQMHRPREGQGYSQAFRGNSRNPSSANTTSSTQSSVTSSNSSSNSSHPQSLIHPKLAGRFVPRKNGSAVSTSATVTTASIPRKPESVPATNWQDLKNEKKSFSSNETVSTAPLSEGGATPDLTEASTTSALGLFEDHRGSSSISTNGGGGGVASASASWLPSHGPPVKEIPMVQTHAQTTTNNEPPVKEIPMVQTQKTTVCNAAAATTAARSTTSSSTSSSGGERNATAAKEKVHDSTTDKYMSMSMSNMKANGQKSEAEAVDEAVTCTRVEHRYDYNAASVPAVNEPMASMANLNCNNGNPEQSQSQQQMLFYKQIRVGTRVAVYWDGDDEYFQGTVTKERELKRKRFFLKYDDGDREWIDLRRHKFRIVTTTKKKNNNNDEDDNGDSMIQEQDETRQGKGLNNAKQNNSNDGDDKDHSNSVEGKYKFTARAERKSATAHEVESKPVAGNLKNNVLNDQDAMLQERRKKRKKGQGVNNVKHNDADKDHSNSSEGKRITTTSAERKSETAREVESNPATRNLNDNVLNERDAMLQERKKKRTEQERNNAKHNVGDNGHSNNNSEGKRITTLSAERKSETAREVESNPVTGNLNDDNVLNDRDAMLQERKKKRRKEKRTEQERNNAEQNNVGDDKDHSNSSEGKRITTLSAERKSETAREVESNPFTGNLNDDNVLNYRDAMLQERKKKRRKKKRREQERNNAKHNVSDNGHSNNSSEGKRRTTTKAERKSETAHEVETNPVTGNLNDNWVAAGCLRSAHDSSDDSETDEEEIMQWGAKMFGVTPQRPIASPKPKAEPESARPKPKAEPESEPEAEFNWEAWADVHIPISEAVKLGRRRNRSHVTTETSVPNIKRRKVTVEEPTIEKVAVDVEEEEAKRKKQEAKPLTADEIKSILGEDSRACDEASHWVRRSVRQPSKSILNSPQVKALFEKLKSNDTDMVVLKMKKYLNDPDAPPVVLDAVLDALEENTNCEALYIQVSS